MSNLAVMFRDAESFNQDLSSWVVRSSPDLSAMFEGAISFNQDLSNWDVSQTQFMDLIFNNSGISQENYESMLTSWSSQPGLQTNVNLGAEGLKYCAAKLERMSLIDNYSWSINGDIPNCPFITTWKTDNPGNSNNTSFTIPASISGSFHLFDVDWNNDGTYDTLGVTGSITHDYGISDSYQVAIRGNFPRISFLFGDKEKIISIDQWGDIMWASMESAFKGCSNLQYNATDSPNLSNVTSMRFMFSDATLFNGDISNWDVSTIEDMDSLFLNAEFFNRNLGSWDISSANTMTDVFKNCGISQSNYDGILIGWESQSGLQMDIDMGAGGLKYCDGKSARQSLIDNYNWNITGDSEDCPKPFITTWQTDITASSSNTTIRLPIGGTDAFYSIDWNNDGEYDTIGVTSSITHDYGTPGTYQVAIRGQFSTIRHEGSIDAEKLISIDQWGDAKWSNMFQAFYTCENMQYNAIDTPDLSNVTDMSYMFGNCTLFDGAIGGWDVSNVKYLDGTFRGATSFNQNIGNWDVSNVETMEATFSSARAFNQDISGWDVDSVTIMYEMFAGASSFNQDIGEWNPEKVEDMEEMFKEANSFNQDISGWNLSSVNGIRSMFRDAISFNQDLSNWDISHIDELNNLFNGATSFNQDLGDWNIDNVTDMTGMLDNTNLSQQNYDNTLKKWAQGQFQNPTIQSNVNLGVNGLQYCTASSARKTLWLNLQWTINGDQYNCSQCTTSNPNEWVEPAVGNWNATTSWSQGTVPDMFDLVIIPSGKEVTINAPFPTMCHSIDVVEGGSLITANQSELLITLGIPIDEGSALRNKKTH